MSHGEDKRTDWMLPALLQELDKYINLAYEKMARMTSLRNDIIENHHIMLSKLNSVEQKDDSCFLGFGLVYGCVLPSNQ